MTVTEESLPLEPQTPPLLFASLMTKLVLRGAMTQFHLSVTQDPEKMMVMITNGTN